MRLGWREVFSAGLGSLGSTAGRDAYRHNRARTRYMVFKLYATSTLLPVRVRDDADQGSAVQTLRRLSRA